MEDAMCTQFGDLGQKLTGVLNMMTPKVEDVVGQIKEVAREIVAEIGGTVEAVGEGMKMTLDESADKLGAQVMQVADIVEDRSKIILQGSTQSNTMNPQSVQQVQEISLGGNKVMDQQGVWEVETQRRRGPKPNAQPQTLGQPKAVPIKSSQPKPQAQAQPRQ